jgi:hypothetical protein
VVEGTDAMNASDVPLDLRRHALVHELNAEREECMKRKNV